MPEFGLRGYRGMTVQEAREQRQQGWAEFLRAKRPKIKEEWYKLSPYERGERPSAFAPRIAKVAF